MSTAERTAAKADNAHWHQTAGELMASDSLWAAYDRLVEARGKSPANLVLRGYIEIIRSDLVRDLLAVPHGLETAPKLTPEFLADFGRFNLNAQQGYLISLIDGRTTIAKLLKLAPVDAFTTLFNLALLARDKVITVR